MSDAYLGEIRLFAGHLAPSGWAFCDGSLLPIAEPYEPLHALIGTTYGGDGSSSFALPDLRGRIPLGAGSGGGNSPRTMGERGGAPTVTLTPQQLPAHNHVMAASNANATTATPSANVTFGKAAPEVLIYADTSKPTGAPRNFNPATIGNSGGTQIQPHENMMPTVAINFIICVSDGIMPSA